MLDVTSIIVIMLLLLVLFVISLVAIFKTKFNEWDQKLSEQLKKIIHPRQEQDKDQPSFDYYNLPGVSYSVKDQAPSGEILKEQSFAIYGYDLDISLNSLAWLKDLAEGKLMGGGKNARSKHK